MVAKLTDGFSTTVSFGSSSLAALFEVTVTPISYKAGGGVDTTTMHNDTYRTQQPKKLISLGDMKIKGAYDPVIFQSILDMIGVVQQITILFPDTHTVSFYGWVDELAPGEMKEGEMPTVELTIIASNQNGGSEQAPAYT